MSTTMSPMTSAPPSTHPEVLNPALFAMLHARFPRVSVKHRGERRVVKQVAVHGGRKRFEIVQRGEQYAVDCRFCGDKRQRLFVSYAFGTVEPGRSDPNYRLWCCHNEMHCHTQGRYQLEFASLLGRPHFQLDAGVGTGLGSATTSSAQIATVAPAMQLPDWRSIADLVPNHPAVEYLSSVRGFDVGELASVWGVGYCQVNVALQPSFCHRIVVPVWRPRRDFGTGLVEWMLAGWQARFIGEHMPANEPKYLSAAGMPTSQLWYGLPQALGSDGPIVIVEGVTDVWRLRAGGLALLGSELPSRHQMMLLQHYFSHRPIVVMLDGEAREKAIDIERMLRCTRMVSTGDRRVIRVDLPHGQDPATLTRGELWATINDAVR